MSAWQRTVDEMRREAAAKRAPASVVAKLNAMREGASTDAERAAAHRARATVEAVRTVRGWTWHVHVEDGLVPTDLSRWHVLALLAGPRRAVSDAERADLARVAAYMGCPAGDPPLQEAVGKPATAYWTWEESA